MSIIREEYYCKVNEAPKQNWRPEGWDAHKILIETIQKMGGMTRESLIEAGADAMLEAIRSEIEKVENPYKSIEGSMSLIRHSGFESCRQKILSLLKE